MKKITLIMLVLVALVSCIKKDALKYDPELVGNWVSNEDSVYTWLNIKADGMGDYETFGNTDGSEKGEIRYSLWETKLFVGNEKFRVKEWITGKTDGVYEVATRVQSTLKDTVYNVDMKMILKTKGLLNGRRYITLYRVHQ